MTTPHIDPNSVSLDTLLEAALGERVPGPNATTLMLVKAAADIPAAAKTVVAFTDTEAKVVDHTSTASSALVAGLIPEDIRTISDTAGQLDAGTYFYVIVQGVGTAISAATVAAGAPVGTSTTDGRVDDAAITVGADMGVALTPSGGIGEDLEVLVRL